MFDARSGELVIRHLAVTQNGFVLRLELELPVALGSYEQLVLFDVANRITSERRLIA